LIKKEMREGSEFMKDKVEDSSDGSESAPSEDNLSPAELNKNLPDDF